MCCAYACRQEDARRRRARIRVLDGGDSQGRVERSAQAGSLLLPTAAYRFLLLAYCVLYSLLTTYFTCLLLTCIATRVCRLRSHVQIRSVLRESVDPYAVENADF